MTHVETGPGQPRGPNHFQARSIENRPELLEASYRLRYRVYCLERKFLRAEDYPQGLELDEFDRHSIHVGAVDAWGDLAGTARAVRVSEIGLPLFHHCTTFVHETECDPGSVHMVEVGRLSVSRTYRRRAGDNSYGMTIASSPDSLATHRQTERRGGREDVLLTLLKALYQATKRIGATHWLAAMEESLERLVAQHGLSFRVIGPKSDYFGLVAPYRMDLKEFDKVIMSGRFPELDEFLDGLEPEFGPRPAEDGRASRSVPGDR